MSRVSVLMCTYQEPLSYVSEAINSILSQTYTDLEYVMVLDDPDNIELLSLLKKYEEKDPRVHIYVNEINVGLTKSLNIGLKCCSGKYIVRIDADDISMLDRIEKQVAFMDANPNIVASGTSAITINAEGKQCYILKRNANPHFLKTCSVFESPIYHPAAIFCRIIDGIPVHYNEEFRFSQDYALWISIMDKHDISNLDECLIKYRVTDNQISTKWHFEQQECAIKNQATAIKMLQLPIDDEKLNILSNFTRTPRNIYSIEQIELFIEILLKECVGNKNLIFDVFRSHLLLIYYNYLPKYYSVFKSIASYVRLSLRLRFFYGYGFLSLINKYIIKINKQRWF